MTQAIDLLKIRTDEEFIDDVIADTQVMPKAIKAADLAKSEALLKQRTEYWGTRTMDKKNPLFWKGKRA